MSYYEDHSEVINFTKLYESGAIRNVVLEGLAVDVTQGTNKNIELWPKKTAYTFPSAAGACTVASTSVDDTALGTGARTILIQGLDAQFNEIEQTVSLNGTTPVPIPTPIYRVNFVFIQTAGSVGSNIGTVDITHPVAGVLQTVQPSRGFTFDAIYTIPAGYTAWLKQISCEIQRVQGATAVVVVDLRMPIPNAAWQTRTILGPSSDGNSRSELKLDDYKGPFPAGMDLRFRIVDCSSNNTDLFSLLELILVRDNPRANGG